MTERHGIRPDRSVDEPCPTLTIAALGGSGGAKLRVVTGGVTSERYESRPVTDPAPPITGAGNTYVGPLEAFTENDVSRALKLGVSDALKLQSFRADYPVAGTKTKQFEQIGNAVPPMLAAHVLAVLIPARVSVDNTGDTQ